MMDNTLQFLIDALQEKPANRTVTYWELLQVIQEAKRAQEDDYFKRLKTENPKARLNHER